ncbi:MAG: hypothetical protein MUF70_13075 [Myxococcota bacterium]|jgi:hypothetical protein|nr:hypothetical protein [Myxococcota bacterium]
MAAARGKRRSTRASGARAHGPAADTEASEPAAASLRNSSAGLVPDLLRRAIGLGVSGIFTTEEMVRRTFGESVPREWADFAAAQTDRARRELTERIAAQIQKKLDDIGIEDVLQRLLRGHTVEVEAKIRFAPREADDDASRFDVRVTREEKA